jgi:hypothetical protein
MEEVSRVHHNFFSKDAMSWFGSVVESELYDGPEYTYFITSEQDIEGGAWNGERRYTIRMVTLTSIETVGDYGQFDDYDSAFTAMRTVIDAQSLIRQGEDRGFLSPFETGGQYKTDKGEAWVL